eukprot:801840-Pleurochrysis_carterae.AAC.1
MSSTDLKDEDGNEVRLCICAAQMPAVLEEGLKVFEGALESHRKYVRIKCECMLGLPRANVHT